MILTDRPELLKLDGQRRGTGRPLHAEDGPALRYRDGWSIYAWHGTRVPADLIEDGWSVDRILAEENTEIRRCAIEKLGWPEYLSALGVVPVDEQDDPGNPGHRLALYDVPDAAQVYDDRVRLLVMDNASRDRDGSRRVYAESVPADVPDAVSAAAWQFDVDPETYRRLARAT